MADLHISQLDKAPAALVAAANEAAKLSKFDEKSGDLIKFLNSRLPNTKIVKASPSSSPDYVRIHFDSGKIAYSTWDGKYILFGLLLNTTEMLFEDKALDGSFNGEKND